MYNLYSCIGKVGTWQIFYCFLLLSGCKVPLGIQVCGSLALRTVLKNNPHICLQSPRLRCYRSNLQKFSAVYPAIAYTYSLDEHFPLWRVKNLCHVTLYYCSCQVPHSPFPWLSPPWGPSSAPRQGGLLQPCLASQHPCSHLATTTSESQLPQLTLMHMSRQDSS